MSKKNRKRRTPNMFVVFNAKNGDRHRLGPFCSTIVAERYVINAMNREDIHISSVRLIEESVEGCPSADALIAKAIKDGMIRDIEAEIKAAMVERKSGYHGPYHKRTKHYLAHRRHYIK